MFDCKKFVKTIQNFLSTEECNIVLSCHKESYYMDHGALNQGSKSSFNFFKNKSHNEFLDALNDKIDFSNRLFQHLDFKPTISNIWLNRQTKNSFLLPHVHEDSVMSGSLYVSVDKNSSNIKFFHLTEFEMPAKLGSLFIFPSSLKHSGSSKNMSDERIVLSFNLKRK